MAPWLGVYQTAHRGSPSGGSLGLAWEGFPGGRLASLSLRACPVFQCFIKISAAYGSTKDISVYNVLGLPASQIFIVGRSTKKYQTQCQVGGGGAGGGEL